jgi:vanillate O-demethylase ferredoxin subunit
MAATKELDWRAARLRAVRDLTRDIRLFEIEPTGDFVAPTPGSHINVVVHIDGRPDTRSYSVVGPCPDGAYRIAVKRLGESRGGSAYMWSLAPGAQMTVSTPGNHFELGRGRPEYLLLAGGIGITPIFALALALAQAGAKFRLLYACRGRQDLALADELRERIGNRLELFVGDEGRRVDIAAEIARLDAGGEFYVCGPIRMLEAAKRDWQHSGRPVDQLRFETFGSSGRFAAEPFKVKIPRLNLELDVAVNQSMLQALEAAGIDMISDCLRGECGLCALPILGVDGVVDHRDVFFSDEEKAANTKLCTCVSRVAGGSITIDTADRVG